ncbi:MAG: hypothetical protein WCD47_23915, partial [Candidatus Sulfotelmatobacter sp.]
VQDIGHAHGAYKPPPDSMSRTLLSLAGFQVIISGRFWVIAEDSPTCIANLARAYVATGKRSEAERLLSDLKKRSNPAYSYAPEIAIVYVSLGDADQAVNWLEKGYEERFNPGVLLRPGFDPLRSDSRFKDLLHRMGLSG